jgi:hypothetical protein
MVLQRSPSCDFHVISSKCETNEKPKIATYTLSHYQYMKITKTEGSWNHSELFGMILQKTGIGKTRDPLANPCLLHKITE